MILNFILNGDALRRRHRGPTSVSYVIAIGACEKGRNWQLALALLAEFACTSLGSENEIKSKEEGKKRKKEKKEEGKRLLKRAFKEL